MSTDAKPEAHAVAIPQADADALETLNAAVERAVGAYRAVERRIAGGGKVQRLAPGAWILTVERKAPEKPAEPGGES